jgi:hypothetical protein
MRMDDLVGARGGRLKGVVVISQCSPVLTFDLLCSAVVRWLHAAVSMDDDGGVLHTPGGDEVGGGGCGVHGGGI